MPKATKPARGGAGPSNNLPLFHVHFSTRHWAEDPQAGSRDDISLLPFCFLLIMNSTAPRNGQVPPDLAGHPPQGVGFFLGLSDPGGTSLGAGHLVHWLRPASGSPCCEHRNVLIPLLLQGGFPGLRAPRSKSSSGSIADVSAKHHLYCKLYFMRNLFCSSGCLLFSHLHGRWGLSALLYFLFHFFRDSKLTRKPPSCPSS